MDADAPPAILVEYAAWSAEGFGGDGMTTLSILLNATKPPLELLDHLTRYQGAAACRPGCRMAGTLAPHLCRRTGSAARRIDR